MFLFVKFKNIYILDGFLSKNFIKIIQYYYQYYYSKRFINILQHFYLYSYIWLSKINVSFIMLIALDLSRNILLIWKYGICVESFVNFMLNQNELMNTWVVMTQSWKTNRKHVSRAKNWVENSLKLVINKSDGFFPPNSIFLSMEWNNITLFLNARIYSGSQLSSQTLK